MVVKRKTRWKTRFTNMVKREAMRHVRQYMADGTFPRIQSDVAFSDAEWSDFTNRVSAMRRELVRECQAARYRVDFT